MAAIYKLIVHNDVSKYLVIDFQKFCNQERNIKRKSLDFQGYEEVHWCNVAIAVFCITLQLSSLDQ